MFFCVTEVLVNLRSRITGMEDTYEDYVSWEASLSTPGPDPSTNAALQKQYSSALSAIATRKPYEDSIAGMLRLLSTLIKSFIFLFTGAPIDYDGARHWREVSYCCFYYFVDMSAVFIF